MSRSTGRVVPKRCNSHLCPECSPLHQMAARHAIEMGLIHAAVRRRSEACVFLTLTEPAKAGLDLPGLARRWKATSKRLRRLWGLGEYALVVEFQERGALHPHVFAEVAPEVAADLTTRRGKASWRRRREELQPVAEKLGWGRMVDAIAVPLEEAGAMGQYGAKALQRIRDEGGGREVQAGRREAGSAGAPVAKLVSGRAHGGEGGGQGEA